MRNSYFKTLVGSFKPSFYKKSAYKAVSNSVKYLFLLVLIAAITIGTYTIFNFKKTATSFLKNNKTALQKIAKEIVVPIAIKKGIVETDVPQPYKKEIKEFEKEYVFVIDTTGKTVELAKDKEGAILTNNSLIIQIATDNKPEIRKYSLSQIEDLTIKPSAQKKEYFVAQRGKKTYRVTYEKLNQWKNFIFRVGWPALMIFSFIFTIIAKFVQIILFSLFLIALNLSSEIRLGYCNLFNIAVYAMTPPTILALVHILTGANFWHFNIVYIITYIAYLVLGYTYARKNLIVEYDEES